MRSPLQAASAVQLREKGGGQVPEGLQGLLCCSMPSPCRHHRCAQGVRNGLVTVLGSPGGHVHAKH